MIKADLHIHTTLSDGSLGTKEAISLAKQNGVSHIAFTNHDTVKGLREAQVLGEKEGIIVIPGIEISAFDYKRKRKVHLLGYNFDLEGKHLKALCAPLLEARHQMSLWQLKTIIGLGYNIDVEQVMAYSKESEVLYKQHIMQGLIDAGYTEEIYSPLYKQLFKGEGPCHQEVAYIDVYEALEAILKDGGKAVLAHPGQLDSYALLEELVDKGLIGVELAHCSHTEADREQIMLLANKYHLMTTGGSDFHGAYGNEGTIGSFTTPLESLEKLMHL